MEKETNSRVNHLENLREYWSLLGAHKKTLVFAMGLMVLIQTASVINKLLFKEIVDKGTLFSAGTLSQAGFISDIGIILSILFGLTILMTIVEWLRLHVINHLETNTALELKQRYFGRILELDYGFHTSHKTGSLISRLIRASGAINQFTDTLVFNFSPLVIQLAILLPMFFAIGATYSAALLGICVAFLLFSVYTARKFSADRVFENQALDTEKAKISDIFTNIDSVKYFGKNKTVKSDFAQLTDKTKTAQLKAWGWWRWMISGHELIVGLGAVILFYVSLNQLAMGQISLGTMTFIYTAYVGLIGPLYWFSHGIRQVSASMADMQDLFEYKTVKRKIKNAPNAKPIEIKRGDIEFKDVCFGFKKECLFRKFNLKIKGGKTIALVGHSGCGKSTLIKLLYRLYDVNSGAIIIDGQDIRTVKQNSLRSEMSIVPQDVILFDETLFNNIRFSNPSATKEEVSQALKLAQLEEFIERLPDKENTLVGERGVKLSGGERQRVAIARAILANKKILVLDEATSALDSKTETEIQKALTTLVKGRTSIIIAHRLSTIMNANEIVVMEKGKIVQRGTHNELIRKKGEYRKLWDLQKGGYLPD